MSRSDLNLLAEQFLVDHAHVTPLRVTNMVRLLKQREQLLYDLLQAAINKDMRVAEALGEALAHCETPEQAMVAARETLDKVTR